MFRATVNPFDEVVGMDWRYDSVDGRQGNG
jgi:hypothetical protein